MSDIADLFEENSFKYLELKEAVEAAKKDLEYAEKELQEWEEDNEGMYA